MSERTDLDTTIKQIFAYDKNAIVEHTTKAVTYAWVRGRYYVLTDDGEWADRTPIPRWRRILSRITYWWRSI